MKGGIGIIGGSGLYLLDGFEDVKEVTVDTPFGATSDAIMVGRLGGRDLAFLPRHGRGHRLLPTEVPYRANIWALKSLGVSRIFSVSAGFKCARTIHSIGGKKMFLVFQVKQCPEL